MPRKASERPSRGLDVTGTHVHRVNISIQRTLHAAAQARAAELGLQGGFSELVARLLNRNLEGCGRDVMKMARLFAPKRSRQ